MNKVKNNILFIVIFIGLLFLIVPDNTYAKKISPKGGKDNSCPDKYCAKNFGIDINVEPYVKQAGLTSSNYYNNTKSREITVNVPEAALDMGAEYNVKIFVAKYNTMADDSIDRKSIDKIKKRDFEDLEKLKKWTISKNDNNGKSWKLPAGYEAVVVVYLVDDVETSKSCKGNKVSCISGAETKTTGDGTSWDLSGVSASEYVQNPDETILIQNLTKENGEYGSACDKAANGIYDSKTAGNYNKSDDNKYTITDPEDKQDYYQNYYNPILGQFYCSKPSVAFNLTKKQIATLANKTLKMFYKSRNLKRIVEKSNNYDEVANYVNNLKDKDGKKLNPTSNTNINLGCEKDIKEKGSKEYLYVEDKPVTVMLSDGKPHNICSTICYEHLTVVYDPPVASIAGLCFTYKVTVKSETKCGVKYEEQEVKRLVGNLQKEMCAPAPICSGNENHTQGGPSEDFDNCIKECDGGKYSQSCINSCYDKVYKNKKNPKSKKETSDEGEAIIENTSNKVSKINVSGLELITGSNDNNMMKIATYTDKQLENYWKESKTLKMCKRENIEHNISECAEYFFEAKTLYPMGKYNASGTAWKTDVPTTSFKSIANQIGRASPYYIRSRSITEKLIWALLGKDLDNHHGYAISEQGMKKRFEGGKWRCREVCQYTGCTTRNSLSSEAFIKNLKISENTDVDGDDFAKIEEALDDCTVSATCEKTETTTDFDIKIENPRESDTKHNGELTGSTTLGSDTAENITCSKNGVDISTDKEDKFSMFVPADDDVNNNTTTGILGLCYNKPINDAQYKTTITFPGSWINYKSRKIEYDKKSCTDNYELKGGYFCSAYDSTNVNEEWWKWRTEMKKADGTTFPYQNPETSNNIKATAKNFGQYNWSINYSCFYAIYDGSTCDDPTDPCCMNPDGEKCAKTKLQDYKFQVIDAGTAFDKDGNQKQGYNWTSAATVVAGINQSNQDAQTYAINPEKYITYIRANEKDEAIYNQSKTQDDYYIYIPSERIDEIKRDYKDRSYAAYNGTFKKDDNVTGLIRYTSDVLTRISGMSGITYKKSVPDKVNNNYNNLGSLLGK